AIARCSCGFSRMSCYGLSRPTKLPISVPDGSNEVVLAGDVVDRSRCCAYTRTDESPFLSVPRPGTNGGTTPGAHGGTCHCTAACGHHRKQGQSRQHTHDTCLYHWVLLLLSPISDITTRPRGY